MNVYQRIILMLGAILFAIILLTSPRVNYLPRGVIRPAEKAKEGYFQHAPIMDARTASVRGVAVLGATILLFFAFKDIKRN